jgi:hypothetical protein
MVVRAPGSPGEIEGFCDRVASVLETCEVDMVVCDVGSLARPGAETVDALARLQLTIKRCGNRLRLANADDDLVDLLRWMGLDGVLSLLGASPLERERQAEEGEESLGVQEESDSLDPSV